VVEPRLEQLTDGGLRARGAVVDTVEITACFTTVAELQPGREPDLVEIQPLRVHAMIVSAKRRGNRLGQLFDLDAS